MKDKDIKKIFTVAWVKERKILVGTVAVIAVIGFIIFIQGKEGRCMKQVEEEYKACLDDGFTHSTCQLSRSYQKGNCSAEEVEMFWNPNVKE